MLLLAAIYVLCYAAIKAGLVFAPPLRFAGLRTVIAGSSLLGVLLATRRPLLPPRRRWPGILALAATGTFLSYGAMFLSPGRTGAGLASVLGNTTPLLVLVLAALFLGEQLTAAKLVALGLGLLGTVLIAVPAMGQGDGVGMVGLALPLLSAAGAAVESVIAKRLHLGPELVQVTAWQLLIGSVPLLFLSEGLERGLAIDWSPRFIELLLFLAFVGTAGAVTLWYWLVQHDEVSRLSLFLFVVPLGGLLLAVTLFGERLAGVAVAGVLITASGIGLAMWEPRPHHR